jgi:hypothetical protein
MLTRDREIGRSLRRVDPQDRAILDLSLRRKVKDEVVAAVLRMQPEDVAPRREAALDRLAAELGVDHGERASLSQVLLELPADQWPADSQGGQPEPTPAPAPAPERHRLRPLAVAAVVVVGALLGALIGLLLFGGDSEDEKGSPAPPPAQKAVAPASVSLEPITPDFPGQGTARIEGTGTNSRLVMSLRNLPPREEAYAVWLYNSVGDAKLVDRAVGTTLDLNRRLPADPAGYKYIDVSREPIDDNPNHGGASVLRVPIAGLTKTR